MIENSQAWLGASTSAAIAGWFDILFTKLPLNILKYYQYLTMIIRKIRLYLVLRSLFNYILVKCFT